MKRLNAALFVLILGLSLGSVSLNLWAQENGAVARINGVEISKTEFYELLERQYGSYALQELIQKELVRQKAEALQVEIDDDQFAELYSLFQLQVGGPEALEAFLLQNQITKGQLQDQLRWNMLISALTLSEVEAPEETVTEWFEKNRSLYDRPEQVEVSHILVETETEAKEILAALHEEADFAELAQEKSQEPGTAGQGGYLGRISRGQTVPGFEDKAFSLSAGEFGLAESDFGWHIILAHEKLEEQAAVLADIYEMVENDYKREHALDPKAYLEKLEREADIQILFRPR